MSLATVIGAGGYIGARLARRLREAGREVFAPARDAEPPYGRALGTVFYCAGLTGDFDVRPYETVEAHVGVLNRLLGDAEFDSLIYLSSTRLYDSLGAQGGREDAPLAFDPAAPRNVYDLSKALGENLTLARSGGRGAVARLSNVVDPDDEAGGFLSDLLAQARRSRSLTLPSSPDAARDYVHVEDVLDALLAMEQAGVRQVVNVASGRNLANAELAQILAQAGWTLSLTGPRVASNLPRCSTERLRSLGVAPRDVAEVLAEALRRPGFFRG
jgi:nucleoside-diphosphate-sugar epimerase